MNYIAAEFFEPIGIFTKELVVEDLSGKSHKLKFDVDGSQPYDQEKLAKLLAVTMQFSVSRAAYCAFRRILGDAVPPYWRIKQARDQILSKENAIDEFRLRGLNCRWIHGAKLNLKDEIDLRLHQYVS